MNQSQLAKALKNNDGFISIIAIGMFAMLSIFGIIVQTVVVDTVQAVKNTNNYYEARDIADSFSEYLQYQLNHHDSGWNFEIGCEYENGTSTTKDSCQAFEELVSDRNVDMEIKIKGRSEDNERLVNVGQTGCPGGFTTGCYVVPFPGTGTAGERCHLYDPVFNPTRSYVPRSLTGADYDIEQTDYSCNWGKLSFGSGATDRVSIPFFYEDDAGQIINPYAAAGFGAEFALRVRPPCLPCVYETAGLITGQNRLCSPGQDVTVCKGTNERYQLSSDLDDEIILQWQLEGTCTDTNDECGLIPYVPDNTAVFSAILGFRLDPTTKYIVFKNDTKGVDSSDYIDRPLRGFSYQNPRLPVLDQGVLTAFLSSKLFTQDGRNIPYLEYQFLSKQVVADANTKIDVMVNIDGNIFEKTLFQSQSQGLIDFAVQN